MTILANRVISLYNKKTSMRLARTEWNILDRICFAEKIKRKELLELIDRNRDHTLGLTPSVRLFSLIYLHTCADKSGAGYLIDHSHKYLEKTLSELKF